MGEPKEQAEQEPVKELTEQEKLDSIIEKAKEHTRRKRLVLYPVPEITLQKAVIEATCYILQLEMQRDTALARIKLLENSVSEQELRKINRAFNYGNLSSTSTQRLQRALEITRI